MSYQFPETIVIDGETYALANGRYRGVNSGTEIPASATIDLTNDQITGPPNQQVPARGSTSGTLAALRHWRPTVLCWNRPLNPAKNIEETDPNPPLGWETELPGVPMGTPSMAFFL